MFEGLVTSRRGGGTREMLTVRKISFGVGVERTFPLHSPFVSKLELVGRGKARRAKLYFLRDRTGKASRLKRRYMAVAEAPSVQEPAADAAAAQRQEETPVVSTPAAAARETKPAAKPAK